jgi:hypothetical protein
LLWGADLTLCTGLAKLWALDALGLAGDDMARIRWRNAAGIFPAGSLGLRGHDQPAVEPARRVRAS